MPGYNTSNLQGGSQQNLSGTAKTIMSLTAQTTGLTSASVVDITFAADGSPADNVILWDVMRQTAASSGGSAVTPNPTDGAKRASSTVSTVNPTGEGTITANSQLYNLAINQRASFRWVATPGNELIIPAVNLSGVAIRAKSPAYTSTVECNATFTE